MATHHIDIDVWDVTCSCGWAYVRPDLLDEWRTNRAIVKHLKEAAP